MTLTNLASQHSDWETVTIPCPPATTALANLTTTGLDILTLTPALHLPAALTSLTITFTTSGTTSSLAKSYRTPFPTPFPNPFPNPN